MQQSLFPVLLASVRYDRPGTKVTIVEYELKDGYLVSYTGRQWIRDTKDKPVNLLLRDLELRLAP